MELHFEYFFGKENINCIKKALQSHTNNYKHMY